MSDNIYNLDYQSKLSKWYVLIGAYVYQNSNEYSQRIILTSLKNHIASNRIDYSIACQQAIAATKENEYWELTVNSVNKFISLWSPSGANVKSRSREKTKQLSSQASAK